MISDRDVIEYAVIDLAHRTCPDLEYIADVLVDEFNRGDLVRLYWYPLVIAAKEAKAFGWLRTTPRRFASELHDNLCDAAGWAARHRLWELLADCGLIKLRFQGDELRQSTQVDVFVVEHPSKQSMSPRERQQLKRARQKASEGVEPHWTVAHLLTTEDVTPPRDSVTVSRDKVTVSRDSGSLYRDIVTTREKTRQDETGCSARAGETAPAETTSQPASSEIEQAAEIMASCSKPGSDAAAWLEQMTYYQRMRPKISLDLYPAAALRAKARISDTGRPFTVSAGWKYVERALTDLRREASQQERKDRTARTLGPPTDTYTGEVYKAQVVA